MVALSSEVVHVQNKCSRGPLLPHPSVREHNPVEAKERGIVAYSLRGWSTETHDPEQTAWKDRSKAEDKEGTTCYETHGRYDPIFAHEEGTTDMEDEERSQGKYSKQGRCDSL